MGSSPPSGAASGAPDAAPPDSSVAFALRELIACWDQAYEAMTRGDLTQVTALLDHADPLLAAAGDGDADTPAEAKLRASAATAYGRLQHAMSAGLTGIRAELQQARRGAKAIRGYGNRERSVGSRVARSV